MGFLSRRQARATARAAVGRQDQLVPDPVLVKRFGRSARILGGLAGTIGAVSLLGWVLDVDILKSVVLGQATMKANTALCFIVSGASLWISCQPSYGRVAHRLAKVSASIVAVAGLMSLSQYVFGVDLGIDQLLFQDTWGAVDLLYPGRMAANTAIALMLVGLGLLLLDVSLGGRLWPSPVLAGVTGSLSLLVLTGYASGVVSLFEVSEYAQMAMPTALAFLLVSLAIVLARPERGPMRLVSSNGAGGELARHLLPAAVGIPLVVGALRLLGQMRGLYDTYVGVWLYAVVTVVLITTLVWRFASSHEHAELERKQIEETNRRTIETARDAFISMSSEGLILDWNSAAEMLFGWSRTQALGQDLASVIIPPELRRAHHDGIAAFLATGKGRYSTRRSSSRRSTATDTASRSRPRYGL